MQLMEGMDASIWAALMDPSSGSGFDVAKFTGAAATLTAHPGTKALAADLAEIVRLMKLTIATKNPFTSGARPGAVLAGTVDKLFTPVALAMQKVRATEGCPGVVG